jgi:hypothetical protein
MEQEPYAFEEGNALFLKRNASDSNVYVISHNVANISMGNNTETFGKEGRKNQRYKLSQNM